MMIVDDEAIQMTRRSLDIPAGPSKQPESSDLLTLLLPSGSLRFGLSAAPLPARAAPLPVPRRTARPVPAVQGRRLWNAAHAHRHHAVRHDQ